MLLLPCFLVYLPCGANRVPSNFPHLFIIYFTHIIQVHAVRVAYQVAASLLQGFEIFVWNLFVVYSLSQTRERMLWSEECGDFRACLAVNSPLFLFKVLVAACMNYSMPMAVLKTLNVPGHYYVITISLLAFVHKIEHFLGQRACLLFWILSLWGQTHDITFGSYVFGDVIFLTFSFFIRCLVFFNGIRVIVQVFWLCPITCPPILHCLDPFVLLRVLQNLACILVGSNCFFSQIARVVGFAFAYFDTDIFLFDRSHYITIVHRDA